MTQSELATTRACDLDPFGPRLAAAPISWGVCEVPGWGVQLPAQRVLGEMHAVGFGATEAGAAGYLPEHGRELARLLSAHGLALVGGFVPVVLHERAAQPAALAHVLDQATRFAAAGGTVLVSAVVTDAGWSPRIPLDSDAWVRVADGLDRIDEICGEHGLTHALHPHVGTLVETGDDLARVIDVSAVRLCLDTGHFAIGEIDGEALVRADPGRVAHVHLKDVREDVAVALRAGETSLVEATRRGLFVPLGDGDAPVREVVDALEAARYTGWYVLEQDTTIDGPEDAGRPVADLRRTLGFLETLRATPGLAGRRAGGR